ncbi:hypothetical protein [Streptomyces sp. IBSNAI001]|uniref:hypothetical protein n=1 Tax=Streptomyces sp. IBSNAI001 TaxID=3457499 RepID=UPI003FD638CE
MTDIKAGDRVRVVREFRYSPGSYAGSVGVLITTDDEDSSLPYEVRLDGESETAWFHLVELETGTAAASDLEALVTRAKELLAGTDHTASDIIRLAEFLAG